tara:strand:- start:1781 stop:8269 length:6489 start_codon:yes stop_codon:yes gene_type:complete
MKTSSIITSVLLLSCGFRPASTGAPVGFIEKFAIAENREEALKELIPGTRDYYYFHALHAQNRGDEQELERVLGLWIKRYGHSGRVKEIRNRQALLSFEKNPDETFSHLRAELQPNFNHSRLIEGRKPSHPTKLDPDAISYKTFLDQAFRQYRNVQGVSDRGLENLETKELNPDRLRHFLSRLQRPDLPDLANLVDKDLRAKHTRGFGSHAIHRNMTKDQLDELLQLGPNLLANSNFINVYLTKLAPSDDLNLAYDLKEKERYLNRIHLFAQRLAPAHNSLKANVIYHILKLQRSRGEWNRELFMKYLSLPRRGNYVNPKRWEEALRKDRRIEVNLNADYRPFTGLDRIRNDEPLVRSFLLRFFLKDPDYLPFSQLVREDYLKPLFAEAKLTSGSGNLEKWFSMLDGGAVNALRDRVDLDFSPDNKEFFSADEAVGLKLAVKNVQTLLVKAFEINTFNHYSRNLEPVDTAINLDGLSATWERVLKYKDAPMLRSVRTFDFPELNKPGVYVVEFIGNGKSSRALVTKGDLRILEKVGPAGHEFRITDEKNKKRPQASIWLEGTEYSPDKQGVIRIPFTNRPGKRDLVLRDGSFCALSQFDHLAESYELDSAFHIDREALVKGATAKVILRPLLRLNGYPVSTNLLEDTELVISSVDLDGIPNNTKIDLPKFEQGRDYVHEFPVPERLASLAFSFSAKVKNLSRASRDVLATDRYFTINESDKTLNTDALFLSQTGRGYFIEALGRNGEAVPDRAVVLVAKHLDFQTTRTLGLKTDRDGRIALGAMPGIEWIRVSHPDGSSYQWPIDRDRSGRNVQPSVIHASADEVIEVAVPWQAGGQDKASVFSLFSKKKSFYASDHSAAVTLRGGYLLIAGLAPGDYELFLKHARRKIVLRVTDGKRMGGFVLSDNRALEDNRLNPVQVQAIAIEDGKAKILIGNAGKLTRVHVYATRYLSNWDNFSAFDVGGPPSSYSMGLSRKRSLYVEERVIGEEYRYVLDRRYARKYPGNMLARPGLILNPWSLRKTETGIKNAQSGEAYEELSDLAKFGKEQEERKRLNIRAERDYPNLDFLGRNALLWANVKPGEDGIATVDLKGISGQQRLHVYAVDAWNVAYRPIALASSDLPLRELRMARALEPKKSFSEQKLFTSLAEGEEFKIEDVTTSKVTSYDSLAKAYSLLSTLSGNSDLTKFGFILQWPGLKEEEKRAKYSEFACHELHFFLHQKDPAFFAKVVRPYLANKKDKTFLDHWLLGDDLSGYLEPFRFSCLNAVEKILMARKLGNEGKAMARHIGELSEMIPADPEKFNRLFDSAIGNSALDSQSDDSLGFDKRSDLMKAQNKQRFLAGYSSTLGTGGYGTGGSVARDVRNSAFLKMSEEKAETEQADHFYAAPAPPPALTKSAAKAQAEAKTFGATIESEIALPDFEDTSVKGLNLAFDFDAKSTRAAKRARDKIGYLDASLKGREAGRQFYRKLPPTEEWAENNYYRLPLDRQKADLIKVNPFWNDFAAHPNGKPFLSGNFIYSTGSFAEMMFVLSVLDLPFEAEDHQVENEGVAFSLRSGKPLLLFHQEVREAQKAPNARDILLSQNFYRADSRYINEGGERLDNFVKDEFLKQIAYGCQVVITNPTSSVRKLQYLAQIPTGAVPLQKGFYSEGRPFRLEPYSTRTIEFYFYFPETGKFPVYPIQVASEKGHLAGAQAFTFKVVDKLSERDESSWVWVSQNGTAKEVLQYLRDHNLNRIALDKIAFRMRNENEGGDGKAFFAKTLQLLSARFAYDPTLWSYALYHKDVDRLREYLSRSPLTGRCGLYLDTPLLSIDPVERGFHQHLEYKPLVNARAHQLGKGREILNNRFLAQYRGLMEVLKYKSSFGQDDLLATSYYLFLQDRVEEGLRFFDKVDPQSIDEKLQHAYLSTYLDFCKGELASARQRAQRYADYPVDRWRNLFLDALGQLDEIDGKGVKPADEENREQAQDVLASSEPSLGLDIGKGEITIAARNLENCTVNYYPMDVELLFSRKPFVKDDTDHFTSIVANLSRVVALPAGKDVHVFPIPEEFADRNVMVEVVAAGLREAKAYYANDLKVQMAENYGRVQVAHSGTGKPLSSAYVKVYARMTDGRVRFYKDGYTDFRGKFDYVSLNTGQLDEVDRFAVLVLDDDAGAMIREATPPKQ